MSLLAYIKLSVSSLIFLSTFETFSSIFSKLLVSRKDDLLLDIRDSVIEFCLSARLRRMFQSRSQAILSLAMSSSLLRRAIWMWASLRGTEASSLGRSEQLSSQISIYQFQLIYKMQFDSSSEISTSQQAHRKLRPVRTTQIFRPLPSLPSSPPFQSPLFQQLLSQPDSDQSQLQHLTLISHLLLTLRNLSAKYNRLIVLIAEDCGLRDLSGMSSLSQLTEAHFQLNFISDISGIVWNKRLQIVDLKDNEIEQTEQLQSLSLLKSLRAVRLDGNHITKIKGYQSKIKLLNLQAICNRRVNRQLEGPSKVVVDQLFKGQLSPPRNKHQSELHVQTQQESFQLRTLVNFTQIKRQESTSHRKSQLTTQETRTSQVDKKQKPRRTVAQSALHRHNSLMQIDSAPLSNQRRSFVYFCNDSHKKGGISPFKRESAKRPATASRVAALQNRSVGKIESFRKQPQRGEKLKRVNKKGVGLLYCQGLL